MQKIVLSLCQNLKTKKMNKIIITIQVVKIVEEIKRTPTLFENFQNEEIQYHNDVRISETNLISIKESLIDLANKYAENLNSVVGVDIWQNKIANYKFEINSIDGNYYLSSKISLNTYKSFDEDADIIFLIPIKKISKLGYNDYYMALSEYNVNDIIVRFKHYGKYFANEKEILYGNLEEFEHDTEFIHNKLKELYIKIFKRIK